jgi:hypothetical protein
MQMELWAIERMQIIRDQERQINDPKKHILEIEDLLSKITNSKKYKFALQISKFIRVLKVLPFKVVKKLYWIEGRRRYSKYYDKSVKSSSEDLSLQRTYAKNFKYKPLISIVVPVYNTDPGHFSEMINSVIQQTYPELGINFNR